MPKLKTIKKLFLALSFLFASVIISPLNGAYAVTNSTDEVYIGGFAAGFMLNTQNVEVIGLTDINSESGKACPAKQAGLKSGDIIKELNGIKITSSAQLNKAVNEEFKQFKLTIERNGELIETEITPIKDTKSGKNRLGMLVRDSLNGIGTITYIDKKTNMYAALGHPVSDSQGNIIEINGGTLYGCSIYDVKKGLRGNPGELKGIFDNADMLGTVTKNCESGLYGNISSEYNTTELKSVEMGSVQNAEMGIAYIYSTLDGDTIGEYEISIVKVDSMDKDNKNYVIKVNDDALLEKAGGIVQGMSGSPIVQNGKLIGAVTHVFINDPTRGYGIAIDNMKCS